MNSEISSRYIRDNFDTSDRLAVVLIQKETHQVIQRVASADRIAAEDFQAWLRYQNAHHFEVYISMNALDESAHGRTKEEVAVIRHVFLDFDRNGTERVHALMNRQEMPEPNYLVNSSPGKWQVVWRVERFDKTEAERLQREMVREFGADPAATDSSRVLRLPGYYNHKYAKPHFVRAETHATDIYRPEHFPQMPVDTRSDSGRQHDHQERDASSGRALLSQSERDWAYARRALSRGDDPDDVIEAIARHRDVQKSDVHSYAERTVRKAQHEFQSVSIITESENDGPARS